MRYGLVSIVAIIGLSLSVAAGLAQSGGGAGGGAGGSGGGAGAGGGGSSGGSSSTTNMPNTTQAGTAAGPGTSLTAAQTNQLRPIFATPSVSPVTPGFTVSVGAAVPAGVTLYTVPPAAVEVVPTYRGYQYFVAGNQIVIVDPGTRRVVQVLDR